MKISILLIFISCLSIVACGQNHSSDKNPNSHDKLQSRDLSKMPVQEALQTKYDSAVLNCNLWTRMNGPLFITDTPDDTVTIDLLKKVSFPKTITLSATSGIHSLDVQIQLTALKLQTSIYSDNYGAQYTVQNSPTIFGEFSGQTGTAHQKGYVGGTFQGNSLIIGENIVSQVDAASSGPQGERSPTVDYVECSILTKAKPAYKDEWTQDAVGNEPSCLLGHPANAEDCMIRRQQ